VGLPSCTFLIPPARRSRAHSDEPAAHDGRSVRVFPTAILAEHLADSETRAAAAVFYGATLIHTSFTFNMLWWLGRWRRLLAKDVSDQGVRTISRRYGVALLCYPAARALAFVSVWLSLGVHLCWHCEVHCLNAPNGAPRWVSHQIGSATAAVA